MLQSLTGKRISQRLLLQTGPAPLRRPPRRWLWPVLLVVAGVLTFCHGCHGDADNELSLGWWSTQREPPDEQASDE